MPFYEYQCSNCGNKLEVLQKISDQPLKKCPECSRKTLKRLIGGGAGIIFKGSGFYLTDYKNTKKPSSETAAKDEINKTAKEPSIKKEKKDSIKKDK